MFFNGGYAESLTKANIFSTRNAFMLHASWLIELDHGDLVFKHFEGKVGISGRIAVAERHSLNTQVYAVGVTYETHARLRFMPSYDLQAGGVPIDVPSNALDSGLMELHATITRLWLETGEQTSESFTSMRRGVDGLQMYPAILSPILTRWIICQHPCKKCT